MDQNAAEATPQEQRREPSSAPEPQPAVDPLLECEKLRDEYLAGWQRAKADYLNLHKELAEGLEEEFEAGKRVILREALAILDSHELALKNMPPELGENGWVKGISDVGRQFANVLERLGVNAIETKDKVFDPAYHESVEAVPSERAEGAVVEEVQKGYMYKGRVLRPARVKIAAKQ